MFQPTSHEDQLRFDLKLTEDHGPSKIHTFTWGSTYAEAYTRVVDTMDSEDGIWDGWSFEISKHGRKV